MGWIGGGSMRLNHIRYSPILFIGQTEGHAVTDEGMEVWHLAFGAKRECWLRFGEDVHGDANRLMYDNDIHNERVL
ncbi:hypothetical protein RSAG8_04869, partial [Rhizoctonia solani AG-8 WAC10335]